jgi:diguanylate cyclase (GGDEF)-like protein
VTERLEDILGSVLHGVRDLLLAESVEVVLTGSAAGTGHRRWVLAGGSSDVAGEDLPDGHPAIWPTVLAGSEVLLLPRGTRGADRAARLGYREAIVVPLLDEAGVLGTLMVAQRSGEARTFDPDDVQVLQTVANQAGLALRNGRLMDRLRREALHDSLTGLPNRVRLRDAVQDRLAELDGGGEGFAVLLLDLDGFKEVNDSLGHHNGDTLLIHVAGQLTRAAGEEALVARLGGDEFAILLPAAATAEAASAAAGRMIAALGEPLVLDGVPVQVRASIGITLAPAHACDVSGLLRHADHAMYAAKSQQGGIRVHAPDAAEPAGQSRLALLAELRRAVLERQITVHVQPQARAATAEVYGVEALIRWNHPEFGVLPPSEFLPLARRHGMIHELTDVVLDQAIAAAAAWRVAGLELSVAVNLTADSLADTQILDSVETALRRHRLPPSQLVLEITEDSVIRDPARAIARLDALRATGVRLAVDDFGTGYSSLSYLRRLPVDEVKIDRSFVTGLGDGTGEATIVRSIIDLARNLGLDVVAEGVEDQAGWDHLARLGCDGVQGHHLARPMPAAELPPWLHGYRTGAQPAPSGEAVQRARLRVV